MATVMGTGVPLLNEYKQEFFWKRFPQTILGGPKLRLGYSAPSYVYLLQVLLFVLPWLLAGIFTVLVEYDIMSWSVGTIVYGGVILLFVLLTQGLARGLRQRQAPISNLRKTPENMLSEEDEIEFDSCCAVQTVNFIIPGHKYLVSLVLHAIVAAVVGGLAFSYLLPSTLKLLYNHVAATVIFFILGWLTTLIGLYPVTVGGPPEPATFQALDSYDLMAYSRPAHMSLFFIIHMVYRYHPSHVLLADQILHALFVILPVLWSLGTLPPIDALVFWLMEQLLVTLFGGSPMESYLKLFVMLVVSAVVVVVAIFIPTGTGLVVLLAATGFLLSLNWSVLARRLVTSRLRGLFSWGWRSLLLYSLLLAAVCGISAGLAANQEAVRSAAPYLAYACLGLWPIQALLADVQRVYVMAGLCRNALYPASAQRAAKFKKRKQKLRVIGIIRRVLVSGVCPFLLLAYLCVAISTPITTDPTNTGPHVWDVWAAARAYRWVWQGTTSCLLEVGVVGLLMELIPATSSWYQLGIPLQLLIASYIHDRLRQLANKLYFTLTVSVMSCRDKKQRRSSTSRLLMLNVLLFPVLLCVIVIATAVSAPLLPLFTLPLFLVGFPRPLRSWPGTVGQAANICPDTVYYQQLCDPLAKALGSAIASGSLGGGVVGEQFLARFQDRLVWVIVLERGYGYCSVSIKGLELQETSCHTAEALRLDDSVEGALEKENGVKCCDYNPHPLSALRVYDAAYLEVYSDARNVLTGVIDSPETLKLVATGFTQALVWILMRHAVDHHHDTQVRLDRPHSARSTRPGTAARTNKVGPERPGTAQSRPGTAKSRAFSLGSIKSSWSDDDNDSLILEPLGHKSSGINLVTGKVEKKMSLPGELDLNESTSDMQDLFGLPVTDVNQKPQALMGYTDPTATTSLESLHYDSTHSRLLAPPLPWCEIPIEASKLASLSDQFPVAWYRHTIALLKLEPSATDAVKPEICKDMVLQRTYNQLCMACYAIVNVLGVNGLDPVTLGTQHVYRAYCGEIPWSPALEFLEENQNLKHLVIKAFRYGVKLAIDQTLLGEASSLEELQEYMEEYDKTCYFGCDNDPEWQQAIVNNTPTLFSLGHNPIQAVYSSRTLSLQEVLVSLSSINAEAVRGQWANLSLELLYLTNDDEERYSIQAHPGLLRNLTVQAADPPLGYPIFSSPPTSVSLL